MLTSRKPHPDPAPDVKLLSERIQDTQERIGRLENMNVDTMRNNSDLAKMTESLQQTYEGLTLRLEAEDDQHLQLKRRVESRLRVGLQW